jgi:hypothetical protein
MSVRSSINEAGLALSSFIAGLIIVENGDGSLNNYEYVGYIAIGMSLVAIWIAHKTSGRGLVDQSVSALRPLLLLARRRLV